MRLASASLSYKCEQPAPSRLRRLLCLLVLFTGLIRLSQALEIGEHVGPVELITLDGRSLTITNYAERRGTVILFLSARGGVAKEEMHTLGELSSRLRFRGILFVGIFPNAEETSDETRRFAQSQGFLFPIYRDPERKATKQFGASVTPEVFLLGADGTLVYRGGIGDTNESVLAPALAAYLDGRPVEPKQVPAKGTPIGQAAPKLNTEDSFGSVAFSFEVIFETIPDVPAHHCSTIAEAANGDLLVVWYGGSYESADDQALFLSRRKKGGMAWSKPEVLIRDSVQPPGNAVVFRATGKRLFIVWCRMEASRPLRRGGGWGQTRLFYRTSKDHGHTWSKDEPFLAGLRKAYPAWMTTLGKAVYSVLPNQQLLEKEQATRSPSGRAWRRSGTGSRSCCPPSAPMPVGSSASASMTAPSSTISRAGSRTILNRAPF